MRHSGSGSARRRETDASARSSLERYDMLLPLPCFTELCLRLLADVRNELYARSGRRDADVTRHLLVKRRAEVGAVERIHSRAFRQPHESSRIARLEDELRVGHAEHRESV